MRPGQGPAAPPLALKYCLIVPSLEERHGGPSKSALGLATALGERGSATRLMATDPVAAWSRTEGNLEISVFRRSGFRSLGSSSGLRAALRRTTADVVHHHSIWLRTLHYAHETARRLGKPFVISPRGMMNTWAWNHHRRRKAFARAVIHPGAFEAATGWHATSEEEAGCIRSLGFRQPVCVAPNGVSIPSPDKVAATAAAWRELIGPQADRRIALFYSRFHKKKRLIELIDCWIENAPKEWLLVVAGIPEEYSQREIEGYVMRSGANGRVRAFNGAGRPPPYGIASLFLLPSHSENFGLSIAEALAHGVPALVTDTTPWAGLNANGAGWCVPWADYGRALRAATAESAESLRSRGAVGRDWVRGEYSWEKWAGVLSEFYSSLRP
jgi:glycosyltransferase involved in cell wall biosynthesis